MLTLGIDLGTSAIKVAIIDESGAIIAQAQSPESGEIAINSPHIGWAEQSPELWWQHTQSAILSLPSEHRARVKAIGIAYQMHGLVIVDKDLNSLRPSIIWCDSRAVEQGTYLAQEVGIESLAERTLNHPGNFTLSKLRWVVENEPSVLHTATAVCLPGDYVGAKLTGSIVTTDSGLSEMMAWDFKNQVLNPDLWIATGAPNSLCPPVLPSFGEHGTLTPDIAQMLGLPTGTPLTYRSGDQPNNAFGLGVSKAGDTAVAAGTSGVLYGLTDSVESGISDKVNRFRHVNGQTGILMCLNGTGAALAWARRAIAPHLSYTDISDLATEAKVERAPLFLPFGNGAERILGNQYASGFLELDFAHQGNSEVYYSVFEGIVFSYILGSIAMTKAGYECKSLLGTSSGLFNSQLFCSLFSTAFGNQLRLSSGDGSVAAARGALAHFGKIPDQVVSKVVDPEGVLNTERFERWRAHLEVALQQP